MYRTIHDSAISEHLKTCGISRRRTVTDSATAEHLKTCEATGTDPFCIERTRLTGVRRVGERKRQNTLTRAALGVAKHHVPICNKFNQGLLLLLLLLQLLGSCSSSFVVEDIQEVCWRSRVCNLRSVLRPDSRTHFANIIIGCFLLPLAETEIQELMQIMIFLWYQVFHLLGCSRLLD